MAKGLASRREIVLRIIISEYIATAVPVASEIVFRNHQLGVSSATIRNDMAYLEEAGYITRPHASAGGIPSNQGYRYYVESLDRDIELPSTEKRIINSLFQEAKIELEEWLKLAADILAHLVGNAALVTLPRSSQCRFKRLELIALHEFLALLVLVLSQTSLKRQFISFDEPMTQEQLICLANKLNAAYSGLTRAEILTKKVELSPPEKQMAGLVTSAMADEDESEYGRTYLEGLRLMLNQPEFDRREKILNIMETMEAKGWLKPISPRHSSENKVQVVIGEENREETLQDLALVFSHYGITHEIGGAIGVIGPTRMDYKHVISAVDYLSQVLSRLTAEVCHD